MRTENKKTIHYRSKLSLLMHFKIRAKARNLLFAFCKA